MEDISYTRLRKSLTIATVVLSAAIFLFVPGFYVITAYQYEAERIQLAAHQLAEDITIEVYQQPDLWQFLEHRFVGLLEQESKDIVRPTHHQILALDDMIVADHGPEIGAMALVRTGEIGDEARPVGQVVVTQSMIHVWMRTGFAGLVGLILSLITFFTIRFVTSSELKGQEAAAAAILDAKREAEFADRAKSEFLANMSHELRTPLNAIIGFSQMIRDQSLGPNAMGTYLEYAGDIHGSGEHLLSIINDILDLSKIEAGEIDLNEQELDVDQVVRVALRLIKTRAHDRGLDVRSTIQAGGAKLRADERLTKQMLLNLLSNAVKFTESGGSVEVIVSRTDKGGIQFAVTDTGVGIAQNDIVRALATFGQVQHSTDHGIEGTGLGLPLVASLADLHGGGLDLISTVGTGTTATIWFPMERVIETA
ncbi:MAG: HAMP domain-containing histidine kinase [Alphaproteobacteria bacterium]|nr:HAMP domain-containing histidine kinase [Alphaproteobacteria bacterium]